VIHPTAAIHPKAKIHPTASVGPYAVIDEHVELGAGCVVGPHVYLTGHTTIGQNNQFHAGCVVGDTPQDLKYDGAPTRVRIGDHNVFREHVTVHRSAKADDQTVIGSHNLIMATAHVAHNVTIGDHVIIANGALLAGHAVVQDRAFISGTCLIHQFTRVGTLAMMQGGAGISKDLPPFTIASGNNTICGLNIVGLRRAGFSPAQRLELKRLYRNLFQSGLNIRQAAEAARTEFTDAPAKTLIEFVLSAKRGVCSDSGGRRSGESDDAED
jgi:UDP-N-acetylglucosamine acyltransferase